MPSLCRTLAGVVLPVSLVAVRVPSTRTLLPNSNNRNSLNALSVISIEFNLAQYYEQYHEPLGIALL